MLVWLVAGLGNPGAKYEGNRHNIGFVVVDELARRFSAGPWQSKFKGHIAACEIAHEKILLLKPSTYMNLSGEAVQQAMAFYKLGLEQIVVVHDDIDLNAGQLKLKTGGGHGGQNGIRNIAQILGKDFLRVRCGVGRPQGHPDVSAHVLGNFSKDEMPLKQALIDDGATAVESLLRDGLLAAQSTYHSR
ncbi:MAG: aminoacyl-tRNA hydrolase [Deltaproteobacteria bacterium]|nr:aminoacyl-tRNA hydrolase [Deltaproteobacteria bacterium]